jgi:hypothetical protein
MQDVGKIRTSIDLELRPAKIIILGGMQKSYVLVEVL